MPIAQLVSSVYLSAWSNRSYFRPLLFSSIVLVIGNLVYAVAYNLDSLYILLLGRLLFGLGSARAVNRRYITDCVPLKMRLRFSAYFVIFSAMGMACGPALSGLLEFKSELDGSAEPPMFIRKDRSGSGEEPIRKANGKPAYEFYGEEKDSNELTGLDAVRLIALIVNVASSARMHKKNCRHFAQHLKLIGNLLEHFKITELKKYPETREPLEQLEDALRKSYVLVDSCQNRSYLYLLAMMIKERSIFKEIHDLKMKRFKV